MVPPSTATTALAAAVGFQLKNPCFRSLADVFFSTYCLVLTSPPPPSSQMQIVFESRLGVHDVLNDCTMTVDGTEFHIPQKGIATKGNAFGSHKYVGKSALRYELGVIILTGNLVWIKGPYPAGKYTNIKKIYKVLRNFLEPGERIEAVRGTAATPTKSNAGQQRKSGGESGDAGEGKGTSRDANRRLKNWGILSQVFRHHIMMHGDVLRACKRKTEIERDAIEQEM